MLYKYRSLGNYKNVIDIILNQRLHAAPYLDMNDPMEGHYLYSAGELSGEMVQAIKGAKKDLRICSLSRTKDHALMWAHYANGNRGIVFGVEVSRMKYEVRPVLYDGLPNVRATYGYVDSEMAKSILCHKHNVWEYEEEERVFITGKSQFVRVKIREIILGQRMKPDDKLLIEKLVSKINPTITVTHSNTPPL